MDSNSNRREVRSDLHEALALALSSSRLHKRLHDPDHVLAAAAADDMIGDLKRAGFVVTAVGLVPSGPDMPAGPADGPRA